MQTKNPPSKQSFRFARGIARAAIALASALIVNLAATHPARAGFTGLFGGGPLYINAASKINEVKNAGYTEVIVWNIQVRASGDLNFNGEFPLCANGAYIGGSTHSDFAGNMASLKQGTVRRITFSIGSSNIGDWQNIRDLVAAQGTGPTSILYRNFQALKAAIPALDAIDFDDENSYHQSSMVAFAVMLGNLGYKVMLDPFTNAGFWTSVASQINSQRAGTVDGVHLQCYAGGGGNSPCSGWNFGSIPVYPGVWDANDSPSSVQTKMTNWKNQCGITGGWMWLYDDFDGTALTAQYASAINTALGGGTGTGVTFYQDINYGGAASQVIPKGSYTLSQLQARGVPNDWASSCRVPGGWTVIMYQHDNFGGTSWTRTADTPNFTTLTPNANDQMSSCKIR